MAVIHSMYREAGTVAIDGKICTQCGSCAGICPTAALILDSDKVRVSEDSPFGCIACGHCMMVCPEGAIAVTGRGASPGDVLPLPDSDERAGADALAALLQARRSVLQRNKPLCRRLGIPDANKPSIALILGYPAIGFRKTIRRRFSHVSVI